MLRAAINGANKGVMRASDPPFILPLYVSGMQRVGDPGVRFDNEGSDYGFRTVILADEVYERLYFAEGAKAAPSFLDIATPDDRLVVVHSFSKSFLMTGWRLGWLVAPAGFITDLGKLIEFNTSCAPVFVQKAGLAGLAHAEEFVSGLVQCMKSCRDILIPHLAAVPGVHVANPLGGMYAFFRVEGQADSLAYTKHLVAAVGLGIAPGAAFGDEAEGWLRWCFASKDPKRLVLGVVRLVRAMESHPL